MIFDRYIICHFCHRDPNLKINMAAKIQDGRHMATEYIVATEIVYKVVLI